MSCWQCERRAALGLPPLPEREETPIEALRKLAWDEDSRYAELTQGIGEARREERRRKDQARKRNPIPWTSEERRAHLKAIRPRPSAEHFRSYWQRKAIQLGLGPAA